jgi:hypothetical protein
MTALELIAALSEAARRIGGDPPVFIDGGAKVELAGAVEAGHTSITLYSRGRAHIATI